MQDTEDLRGRAGLVCSVIQSTGGALRIVLDDVALNEPQPPTWAHKAFVTHKDYAGGAADIESLSDKELADFGHYVLSRLLACHSQYGSKS